MNELIFYDELDEKAIYFLSDVDQKTVNALKFLLEWHTVKHHLEGFGHPVIEVTNNDN